MLANHPLLLAACLVFWPGLASAESTLERIQREGVLRWGADPSGGAPFAFSNPFDPRQVVGFEVELVDRLARHLGVKPMLVKGDWNAMVPSLQAHRIDLILNGLEITDDRAKVVQFSVPYFQYAQQLTVRAADRDRFRTLDDLKGHKIAVLNGSAAIDVLKDKGWTEAELISLDDSYKPFEALKSGRADGVVGESIIARYYAGDDPALHNQPEIFSPGLYGAAVRKDDDDLLAEVNRILNLMKQSGELGEMYQRWGVWSDRQQELGINKGTPQPLLELARYPHVRLSFEWILRITLLLLRGAGATLVLTLISMPLALFAGLVLALMARSGRWWLWLPATVYIQVMRGTPLLVQIYVIFFALPVLDRLLGLGGLLTWPAFAVGILCLSANYAAYEAEVHRAGLEAVPKGQREAALSLGMSESQAFFLVLLPQSFRIILPPVFNDLISMLKDSCLVSVMGVFELLYVAETVGKATFLYGELLLGAAFLYLILSLAADWYGKHLEAWLRQRGAPQITGQPAHH